MNYYVFPPPCLALAKHLRKDFIDSSLNTQNDKERYNDILYVIFAECKEFLQNLKRLHINDIAEFCLAVCEVMIGIIDFVRRDDLRLGVDSML